MARSPKPVGRKEKNKCSRSTGSITLIKLLFVCLPLCLLLVSSTLSCFASGFTEANLNNQELAQAKESLIAPLASIERISLVDDSSVYRSEVFAFDNLIPYNNFSNNSVLYNRLDATNLGYLQTYTELSYGYRNLPWRYWMDNSFQDTYISPVAYKVSIVDNTVRFGYLLYFDDFVLPYVGNPYDGETSALGEFLYLDPEVSLSTKQNFYIGYSYDLTYYTNEGDIKVVHTDNLAISADFFKDIGHAPLYYIKELKENTDISAGSYITLSNFTVSITSPYSNTIDLIIPSVPSDQALDFSEYMAEYQARHDGYGDIDWLGWLFDGVTAFMSAELFPGFSIGGVLSILAGGLIALWALRLLSGG